MGSDHDGYKLMYEPIGEDNETEQLSLVPTDFISFSRQIAMAMVSANIH